MQAETSSTAQSKSAGKPVTTEESGNAAQVTRTEQGQAIIRRNVLWALGAGVVPIPIVDMFAVLAVEAKMLKQLSDLYKVKFSEGAAKKVAASLLTSVGSVGLGTALAGSLFKLLPLIGSTLGVVTVPIFAGAFTHALGKVFLMHFETGGTLLDFDPHTVRTHFKQEFDKAKDEVTTLKKEHDKTTKS